MEIFEVMRYIFSQAVSMMMKVKIFGTNMFYFLLGLTALSFAITAIRMLFFGDGGSDKK